MKKKRIVLHTDGGARGNPGPAGAGAIICDEKGTTIKETSLYLGQRTNNYAEYAAVILGLETVAKHFGKPQCANLDVTINMDSELVCKQLNGEYQIKEATLFPLYIKIHNMCISTFPNITFKHVRRDDNAHADRLANEAMDRV